MKTSLLEELLPIRRKAPSLTAAFDPSTQQSAGDTPGVILPIAQSDDGLKDLPNELT
jgi:hypothetical protein